MTIILHKPKRKYVTSWYLRILAPYGTKPSVWTASSKTSWIWFEKSIKLDQVLEQCSQLKKKKKKTAPLPQNYPHTLRIVPESPLGDCILNSLFSLGVMLFKIESTLSSVLISAELFYCWSTTADFGYVKQVFTYLL